ncbi:MAG: hypothetical protein GC159_19160 [Phycisphaera sp.]|nr:hypothetical protein [Phycisphaera sp.]
MVHVRRSRWSAATTAVVLLCCGAALAGPMEDEKLYELPTNTSIVHPRLLELTAWGLNQSAKLTRLESLGEIRHNNFTQLSDEVVKLLDDPSEAVQTSAMQVVEALDARGAADRLLTRIDVGQYPQSPQYEQALLADTLLAKWKDQRAAPAWADRLTKSVAPVGLLVSAARSLGDAPGADPRATWALLQTTLLDEAKPFSLRLAAADALAKLSELKTVPRVDAPGKTLIASGPRGPLLAARLMARAYTDAEAPLLKQLAVNKEPAVAVIALERLYELNPEYLWPIARQAVDRPDPRVRLVAVRSQEKHVDPAAVDLLRYAINDTHPEVRTTAAQMLYVLAQSPSLNEPIKLAMRDVIRQALTEWKADKPMEHWRAAEQAAILSGRLDDKPAYANLVTLFDHPRHEVRVGAVVGLRPLAVAETRQPMADLLGRVIKEINDFNKKLESVTQQEDPRLKMFSQRIYEHSQWGAEIAQTLGVWRVKEADKTLQLLIPKENPASPRCRASAIWALGWIRENQPDKAMANTLRRRLLDLNPTNPESDEVRLASLIAIARMDNKEEVPTLRNRYREDGLEIQCAARWAIKHLTGEELPDIKLKPNVVSNGFLAPLDRYEAGAPEGTTQ